MLQRKQTIWLLLTAVCAALTLKFSFFSGNKPGATASQPTSIAYVYLTATSNAIVLTLTVALIVGAMLTLFNYKNRKAQLRSTIIMIPISLVNIFLYYHEALKFTQGNYDLTALLSIVIPVLLIMAARGIYKDQKLVKSVDRLR